MQHAWALQLRKRLKSFIVKLRLFSTFVGEFYHVTVPSHMSSTKDIYVCSTFKYNKKTKGSLLSPNSITFVHCLKTIYCFSSKTIKYFAEYQPKLLQSSYAHRVSSLMNRLICRSGLFVGLLQCCWLCDWNVFGTTLSARCWFKSHTCHNIAFLDNTIFANYFCFTDSNKQGI